MITKTATLSDILEISYSNNDQIIKLASSNSKITIEPGSDKLKVIEAEIKKHPTALFFRAKAIKANEPNSNGDYFSVEELLKSYKTFEGVPFFTNHDNQNIENAKGKVIFAEWDEKEKAIYVIAFVDREAFPHICRGISQRYVSGVSMGASVEYSLCNICGNRAERPENFCSHIRNRKGRKFTGTAKNVVTGDIKDFKDELVFEYNYGVKFIELSAVVDPACATCHIEDIIQNDEYLKKVANFQNGIYMVKTSEMYKQSSKEEMDQLNQTLKTLEDIAIKLIKNRNQVEVEFASDLVNILSELQTFVDELSGAGYGNVGGGAIPGIPEQTQAPTDITGLSPELPATPAAPGSQPLESAPSAMPVAQETPMAGTMTGNPAKSLVSMPNLPITAPIKPRASINDKIQKISSIINNLNDKLNKMGDEEMAKRRTKSEKDVQTETAKEILSKSWKEKQLFLEYINKVPNIESGDIKLSVKSKNDSAIIVAENKNDKTSRVWTYDDMSEDERNTIREDPLTAAKYFLNNFAKENINIQKEGDSVMTKDIKEAGAQTVNKQPEVITEAQLQAKDSYHARTNDMVNVSTQKQLESKRTGEQEVLTEAQMDTNLKLHPRTETKPDQVTQAQLSELRNEAEPDQITQAQLENNRVDADKETITERQLDVVDTPWARAAKAGKAYKTAGEHMGVVVDVLADSVISTGATPEEIVKVAGSLIASTKDRSQFITAMAEKVADSENIDYRKRLAYWGSKNVKVAGLASKEIAETIIDGLRKVIAADGTYHPDTVIDALDVVSEGKDGVVAIGDNVDKKLAAVKNEEVKVSKKDELRNALKKADTEKVKRDEERKEVLAAVEKKEVRESERKTWTKADTMIETNFEEMGIAKDQTDIKGKEFKSQLKTFAKGALASKNVKLAAITNVTIDGNTIQIAVQTDSGEQSVEIPIGEGAPDINPQETLPEGDMAGENLEQGLPVAAASDKKMVKTAQTPAGAGVGPAGGVAGGPGAPEAGLPTNMPTDAAVGALTTEGPKEEIPTAGEKKMPYTICPECNSDDVDVTSEDDGDINCKCNSCGAEYEALIKKEIEFIIKKPTTSVGEKGEEIPEAPEVPALPVAAQTNLNKDTIVRIANNLKKHGHVCPACGMTRCKASKDENSHIEYTCPACKTDVTKDILVNVNDPSKNLLRVRWDLVPDAKCKGCEKTAKKLASIVKVQKMIKNASNSKFPMANCIERVARKYGGNSVATYGPCKGKALAECVCGQLEKLGLTKVKYLTKLANSSTQKDPMEECLEEQMKKMKSEGSEPDIKQAKTICNCLKKKNFSAVDTNIFLEAFGGDPDFNEEDLDAMNDEFGPTEDAVPEEDIVVDEGEIDISEPLPESEPKVEETVTIEVSEETAKELADAATEATVKEEAKEPEIKEEIAKTEEIVEKVPEVPAVPEAAKVPEIPEAVETLEGEKEMAMSMQTHKLRRVGETVIKLAATPKVIETVEKDVEAGVPRSKGTIGKEGPGNIDVPMKKPEIPRGNAEMGKEGPNNINKPAGLPNIPVDTAHMGVEKEVQKDMPGINNEIKGTVIAGSNKNIKEAKKMKEVDTVEKDVDAGVPRGKATLGKEGPDNIDVKENKPEVPRANAEMGNEGADNINPKADGPEVPIDNAHMGHEKEVQKDMPGINDEMLKNVASKREIQLERIANARKIEAIKVAAKLLATSRIDENAYDNVVEALSKFELDQISKVADSMYPKQIKTASKETTDVGHGVPAIVIASQNIDEKANFVTKLSSAFTVGSKAFNENLKRFEE